MWSHVNFSRSWCTSWSWSGTWWRSCSWTAARGGSSCPTSWTGSPYISLPVRSVPGLSRNFLGLHISLHHKFFSPGLSCHRAVKAQNSMATTGRRSPSLSSRVALTRPEICSGSTRSSPCSTSCCARCRFAAQPPLQLSLNSVGSLGKLRWVPSLW